MVNIVQTTNKQLEISIRVIIKKELLRFVAVNYKTKKMNKTGVKKLLFVIRYVHDQYITQKLCDNALLENGGTLMFVPACYKKKRNKALDNYTHALECAVKPSILIKFVSDQ